MQPIPDPRKKRQPSSILPYAAAGTAVGLPLLDYYLNKGQGMEFVKQQGQTMFDKFKSKLYGVPSTLPTADTAQNVMSNAGANTFNNVKTQLTRRTGPYNPAGIADKTTNTTLAALGGTMAAPAMDKLHSLTTAAPTAAERFGKFVPMSASQARVPGILANYVRPAGRVASKALTPLLVGEGALSGAHDNWDAMADTEGGKTGLKVLGGIMGGTAAALPAATPSILKALGTAARATGSAAIVPGVVYGGGRLISDSAVDSYNNNVAAEASMQEMADVHKNYMQSIHNHMQNPDTKQEAVDSLRKFLYDKHNLDIINQPDYQKNYGYNAWLNDRLMQLAGL